AHEKRHQSTNKCHQSPESVEAHKEEHESGSHSNRFDNYSTYVLCHFGCLCALLVVLGVHDLVIDDQDFFLAVLTLSPCHEDGFQFASHNALHAAVGTLTVNLSQA